MFYKKNANKVFFATITSSSIPISFFFRFSHSDLCQKNFISPLFLNVQFYLSRTMQALNGSRNIFFNFFSSHFMLITLTATRVCLFENCFVSLSFNSLSVIRKWRVLFLFIKLLVSFHSSNAIFRIQALFVFFNMSYCFQMDSWVSCLMCVE